MFNNEENQELLLKFYNDGISSAEVGRYFNTDHTNILYFWRRMGLPARGKGAFTGREVKTLAHLKPLNIQRESQFRNPRFPKPKNYKDYLQEAGYEKINTVEGFYTLRKVPKELKSTL